MFSVAAMMVKMNIHSVLADSINRHMNSLETNIEECNMTTLKSIKEQAVVKALVDSGLKQTAAAKALGISRGTLRNILQSYTQDSSGSGLNRKVLDKYLSDF